ncbi:MAG: AAA family ATPase [Planctomycetota bacterium]|jgi:predicted ATPase
MDNYIISINVNLLEGLFLATVSFNPGLNIISGENGTLKTKLLQKIKGDLNAITFFKPDEQCIIQAISPKRNSVRRTTDAIMQQFRRDNIFLDSLMVEKNLNDNAFDQYPSIAELFFALIEEKGKDGEGRKHKMEEVTVEFNGEIKEVFSDYELKSEWNSQKGAADVYLIKEGLIEVPIESLSLGEQEILSLIGNLFTSRDRYNTYLIDEPEVHLNWHLEERLFEYLRTFCEKYRKQVIVATHSRAIFKQSLSANTQYLSWSKEGKIQVSQSLDKSIRKKIAGEAIEIIKLGEFSKATFIVEDQAHEDVIKSLAEQLETEILVSQCGNSGNVRSLYRLSKKEGGWQNCYFVVDGDNEGNPHPNEQSFIHLEKYCIENYLFDIDLASKISGKSEEEVKKAISDSITANARKILKNNRFFEFLLASLNVEDITPERLATLDACMIFQSFLNIIGMNFAEYIRKYIVACIKEERLDSVFPKRIMEILTESKG